MSVSTSSFGHRTTPWETLPLARSWWHADRLAPSVVRLTEPHVHLLLAANVFVVAGRDRTLAVDAGMGFAPLAGRLQPAEAPLLLVLTHAHCDHTGGAHEIAERWIHGAEADGLVTPERALLRGDDLTEADWRELDALGMPYAEWLVDARPSASFDPESFSTAPAPASRELAEGDVVDLGDRRLTVLHLPGHSPGGIGLYDEHDGTLFSGDAIYDGPLLDELPGSDIPAYLATMRRLRELPVSVVHPGHDDSFGPERLVELADAYLRRRG